MWSGPGLVPLESFLTHDCIKELSMRCLSGSAVCCMACAGVWIVRGSRLHSQGLVVRLLLVLLGEVRREVRWVVRILDMWVVSPCSLPDAGSLRTVGAGGSS